jgi:hypothetical protein
MKLFYNLKIGRKIILGYLIIAVIATGMAPWDCGESIKLVNRMFICMKK